MRKLFTATHLDGEVRLVKFHAQQLMFGVARITIPRVTKCTKILTFV